MTPELAYAMKVLYIKALSPQQYSSLLSMFQHQGVREVVVQLPYRRPDIKRESPLPSPDQLHHVLTITVEDFWDAMDSIDHLASTVPSKI